MIEKKLKRKVLKIEKEPEQIEVVQDEEDEAKDKESESVSDWFTEPYKVFKKEIEHEKVQKSFNNLTQKLSLNTNRMKEEYLIEAIDSAAADFFAANDLYLIAYNEQRRFETFMEIQLSKLNSDAQAELEEKKKSKEITSQITQALKDGWIIDNKKDQWNFLHNTIRELKVATYRFEALREAWKQRMSLLQSQARAIMQKKQVLLGENKE